MNTSEKGQTKDNILHSDSGKSSCQKKIKTNDNGHI